MAAAVVEGAVVMEEAEGAVIGAVAVEEVVAMAADAKKIAVGNVSVAEAADAAADRIAAVEETTRAGEASLLSTNLRQLKLFPILFFDELVRFIGKLAGEAFTFRVKGEPGADRCLISRDVDLVRAQVRSEVFPG